MAKDKEEIPYVLRFDGRIPAVRWYKNQEEGIKARKKYRKQGYHVLLHPAPALKGQDIDGPTSGQDGQAPDGHNNKRSNWFTDWRSRRRDRKRDR